jgi:hypothetical protein
LLIDKQVIAVVDLSFFTRLGKPDQLMR